MPVRFSPELSESIMALDKITKRPLFSSADGCFGIQHFLYANLLSFWYQPVPDLILTYFAGVALFASGLGIIMFCRDWPLCWD
jgi:hypothetical protein